MPTLFRTFFAALAAVLIFQSSHAAENPSPLTLWYRASATNWTGALPIGNGRLGAMVFGGLCFMFNGNMVAGTSKRGLLVRVGKEQHATDAETTPLRDPEHYQYDFNLGDIAEVWRRGSVIASWLLDLTAASLVKDPTLSQFSGRVSDSGEGRWTIKAAIDEAVPVPVLSAALYERFASRGEADYQDRLLSAMRFGFGGHLEKADGK